LPWCLELNAAVVLQPSTVKLGAGNRPGLASISPGSCYRKRRPLTVQCAPTATQVISKTAALFPLACYISMRKMWCTWIRWHLVGNSRPRRMSQRISKLWHSPVQRQAPLLCLPKDLHLGTPALAALAVTPRTRAGPGTHPSMTAPA